MLIRLTSADPLMAKLMVHGATREEAIAKAIMASQESKVCGPPSNLDFLNRIVSSRPFANGETTTNFLSARFSYRPCAIDVVSGGAFTTVQQLPAWQGMGMGIPESGPMDPVAFQIANILVGNPATLEGLEITGEGPELLFLESAVVAVCGAPFEVSVNDQPRSMWASFKVEAGQSLSIGSATSNGCRSYLAVFGGFPKM